MTLTQTAVLLLSFSTFSGAAVAQGNAAETPRQRLEKATEVSSLATMNDRPWHAKLAVTLFDERGKNPVEATIEYWQAGEETLRVSTAGSNTETRLHHEGQDYRGTSGADVPFLLAEVFRTFMHPGPEPADFDGTQPEQRKSNFGKVPLDCVMLARPMKPLTQSPLGLFPTYCIEPGSDLLRASYDFGGRQVTINRAGKFLNHTVPTEFTTVENGVIVSTMKVLSLVSFNPAPDTFLPGAQLTPSKTGSARIASDVMQGKALSKPQPSYPESARSAHISGTVILHVIIGRDGHVHTLRVMSAPDPSLAVAALAAVRQWTYKPYTLDGLPTEVDTTVVLNFNLNPM